MNWYITYTLTPKGDARSPVPRAADLATMMEQPGEVHFARGADPAEALKRLESELPKAS